MFDHFLSVEYLGETVPKLYKDKYKSRGVVELSWINIY